VYPASCPARSREPWPSRRRAARSRTSSTSSSSSRRTAPSTTSSAPTPACAGSPIRTCCPSETEAGSRSSPSPATGSAAGISTPSASTPIRRRTASAPTTSPTAGAPPPRTGTAGAMTHSSPGPPANPPRTLGYYPREDMPFYYALADGFTICDHFFSSAIGPTDPNRLYSMSATLDPHGKKGGPILETFVSDRASRFFPLDWTTYPEQLEARNVTWKVYGNEDGNFGDNVLLYFRQYRRPRLAAK